MSGHTPGEWSIRLDKGHTFSDGTVDHGGYRIDADGVEQLAYVWNFSDRVDPVSHSQDGTRPFGAHEAEANARLIAAAPMLLDALERALRDSGCDGDLCMHFWHDQARAAIAAATGETK